METPGTKPCWGEGLGLADSSLFRVVSHFRRYRCAVGVRLIDDSSVLCAAVSYFRLGLAWGKGEGLELILATVDLAKPCRILDVVCLQLIIACCAGLNGHPGGPRVSVYSLAWRSVRVKNLQRIRSPRYVVSCILGVWLKVACAVDNCLLCRLERCCGAPRFSFSFLPWFKASFRICSVYLAPVLMCGVF